LHSCSLLSTSINESFSSSLFEGLIQVYDDAPSLNLCWMWWRAIWIIVESWILRLSGSIFFSFEINSFFFSVNRLVWSTQKIFFTAHSGG
jgi:hypothetical protein